MGFPCGLVCDWSTQEIQASRQEIAPLAKRIWTEESPCIELRFQLDLFKRMNVTGSLLFLLVLHPLVSHSFGVLRTRWHREISTYDIDVRLLSYKDSSDYQDKQGKDEEVVDEDSFLGSLDSVLENARRRQGINFQYRVQAILDTSLIKLKKPYPNLKSSMLLTVGDATLAVIAWLVDAKGFAIGYIIGKLTAGPCREIFRPGASVQIILLPLWPVLWAIGLDQLL